MRECKMNRVLGVILARSGSKTIPLKNIALCNGEPLIYYAINSALASISINNLLIVLDFDEKSYQIQRIVEIKREKVPTFIKVIRCHQDDYTTSASVLENAIKKYDQSRFFDIIVEIPCTNVLRTLGDITNAISIMKSYYDQIDSVASVSKATAYHPSRMKKINKLNPGESPIPLLGKWCTHCSEHDNRKQDLQDVYYRNGAVYVMKREVLLKQNDRFGKICYPYIMPEERGINIDTMFDLRISELLLKERTKKEKSE